MMQVSIELVPRSEKALKEELQLVQNNFPQVEMINIPDILRFNIRSWDGCQIAGGFFPKTIPHLRAIDFDPDAPLPILEQLQQTQIEAILVITGDPPQDMGHKCYRTSCLEMIRRLKRELPGVKLYAGLDQYRSSIKEEIDYVKAKRDAGADAFFTQPFFDIRLMDIYQGLLPDVNIFWGVSPVLTENSQNYWENKNNAVFPPDFVPSMEWNREFARQAVEFARKHDNNIYFMPIRTDLKEYLSGIL